ncbi:MAG: SUMF1/EgtB/PvdO family nonheme iron enzyme [Verrucomicrobiota bacterium]
MKKLSAGVIFLVAFLATTVFAAVTVKTNSGVVYENAEVTSVEKDAVMLKHSGGVAKVPLRELSKEARRALGVKATLETAKGDFNQQLKIFKKLLFDLDVSYAGHLGNLEKKAQAGGLLDQVLEVRKELKTFRMGAQTEYKYDKLKKMRAIYDGERRKRRNRIVDDLRLALGQYQIDLKGVQKALTMEDKVDEAIVAKKEEERVVAMLMNRKQALEDLGIFSGEIKEKVASSEKTSTASSLGSAAVSASLDSASKDKPFENSLGMRFVPVSIVGGPSDSKKILFSIWETRRRDYRQFIKKNRDIDWPYPGFDQEEDHPAVNVSWLEAGAFCEWLTEKERKEKKIGENDTYRLPTDHEWSCAVGIGKEEDADALPSTKHQKVKGIYPWGKEWPPPKGVGNFYGEESVKDPIPASPGPKLDGYEDDFSRTAPVGSFEPNFLGLYDMSGNGWEWCQEWFDPSNKERRVVRGMCWMGAGNFPNALLSSYRATQAPDKNFRSIGFRVVLELE